MSDLDDDELDRKEELDSSDLVYERIVKFCFVYIVPVIELCEVSSFVFISLEVRVTSVININKCGDRILKVMIPVVFEI